MLMHALDWDAKPSKLLATTVKESETDGLDDLWYPIVCAGWLFALSGRAPAGLQLWGLASDLVQALGGRTNGVCGDAPMAHVAYHLGVWDFPVRIPPTSISEYPREARPWPGPRPAGLVGDVTTGPSPLERVIYHDRWTRRTHACASYPYAKTVDERPLASMDLRMLLRKVYAHLRGISVTVEDDQLVWRFASDTQRQEALEGLRLLTEDRWEELRTYPDGNVQTQRGPCLLLRANTELICGDRQLGKDYAMTLFGLMGKRVDVGWLAGFYLNAGLITEGLYAENFALSDKEADAALERLMNNVPHRIAQAAKSGGKSLATTKARIWIEHLQFYLEPEEPDPDFVYFQEDEVGAFSGNGTQVAISTPTMTADCHVRIEFARKVPSLGKSVRAVAVPLEVQSPDDLFLATVSGRDARLVAPRGRYTVLARFTPKKASKANAAAGLREWTVRLTFLPEGSIEPGVLREEA